MRNARLLSTFGLRMSEPAGSLVADLVIEQVAKSGVKHVFLIPGGGSMYLVDALGRNRELTPIAMLHEQGAAIAAEAYSQSSGNLGVLLVTTGPGGTNALTGVAAAYLDSTPLLVISGQVKTSDSAEGRGLRQLGFQEVDIVGMAKPITKYAVTVKDPHLAESIIRDAIQIAKTGRPGPVWVDLPLDIQAANVQRLTDDQTPTLTLRTRDLSDAAMSVLRELSTSSRPVVLIGNGLRLSGGERDLLEFVERLGIPVLLTWKALDLLPFDDPLNAGRPGAIATRHANLAHQRCDFYLSIGARLDMGQTGYRPENIAPNAKRFVLDIDRGELAKLEVSRSVLIEGNAAGFVSELKRLATGLSFPSWSEWRDQIGRWKEQYELMLEHPISDTLSTYDVVDVLSDLMKPDEILVPGSSGACSEVVMQAFRNKRGQRVFNSEGLGPMGFGVPAPIGAWFVNPQRNHYSVDGDGGFVMNLQELEIAIREEMKILWFVLDNQGYGSIQRSQDSYFQGRRVASDVASGLTLPNSADIAAAFGLHSATVDSRSGLTEEVLRFQANPSPTVVVAKVDPKVLTSPRVSTTRLSNGRLVTSDLDDLYPKLADHLG